MKTKDEKKPLLLLEGELLLEKVSRIVKSEVKIRILDITRIDAESVILAESVEVVTVKKNQSKISFEVFGPVPDPLRRYIVDASISTEKKNREKKTHYRTTQSIPVFGDGYPDKIKIPLTKI